MSLATSSVVSVTVPSAVVSGVCGALVNVEVDVLSTLPCFHVVGLPGSSVREARERVRSAVNAAQLPFPRRRITVNLAPADLPKHGTGLDLAIALALVGADFAARNGGSPPWTVPTAALGELALSGEVRAVRGILPTVEALVRAGLRKVIVAPANAPEAALVPGAAVYPAADLKKAWQIACGDESEPFLMGAGPARGHERLDADLADVRGLAGARRVLEIAAAGEHSLLLEGPPGSGKSMLGRCLAGILPGLDDAQALEVTRIHSAAGLLGANSGLCRRPPLRSPHHSASVAAMVGGGRPLGPGEVSLAHRGVLFLDELPEFRRAVLEALRQPLQDGSVSISRANRSYSFPARFQLVATRNPCPCGFLGSLSRPCECLPGQRDRYLQRLSGPILDRIELVHWVEPVAPNMLLSAATAESSARVKRRVEVARARRAERGRGLPDGASPALTGALSRFARTARRELEAQLSSLNGSARSVARLVALSQTIADLDNSERIHTGHVQEASLLSTRPLSAAQLSRATQPVVQRCTTKHEGERDGGSVQRKQK
ncbi:MAG: hypothetical protein CMP23_06195 [Rickettsiales bacterium]|nr:hypothetical protein [Rickettsiales bacterium]